MSYEASQELVFEAETLLRAGKVQESRALFRQAAKLQLEFAQSRPPEKSRTRSVCGLSAATLFYRANDLDDAERIACYYISQSWIEAYSLTRLRELLPKIWNQRHIQSSGSDLSEPLSLVFRDGQIGYGLAPSNAVDSKVKSAWGLARRMADFKSGLELSQLPPPRYSELYHTWESQPTAGSYRIDLYLSASQQTLLDFGEGFRFPTPDQIITSVIEFLAAAAQVDDAAVCTVVPDSSYRQAMIRLARNLVPDGEVVGQLEFTGQIGSQSATVSLSPYHRKSIDHHLQAFQAVPTGAEEFALQLQNGASRQVLEGVLRAVNLDTRKLQVDQDDGTKVPFSMPPQILDDAVGPLLNHRVRVSRYQPHPKKKWIVEDIEMVGA